MEKDRYSRIREIIEIINEEYEQNQEDEKNISCLTQHLINFIYDDENYDCLKIVKDELEPDIFDIIEKEVRYQTDLFIKTSYIRKTDEKVIINLMKDIFKYQYKEFEDDEYICKCLNIDKEQMKAIRYFFNYCEFSVILKRVSKRIFRELVVGRGKIKEVIMDAMWDLFDNNRNDIKEIVCLRRLANLEMKVNYLMDQQEEMQEDLGFLQFLIIESNDVETPTVE